MSSQTKIHKVLAKGWGLGRKFPLKVPRAPSVNDLWKLKFIMITMSHRKQFVFNVLRSPRTQQVLSLCVWMFSFRDLTSNLHVYTDFRDRKQYSRERGVDWSHSGSVHLFFLLSLNWTAKPQKPKDVVIPLLAIKFRDMDAALPM